MKKTIILFLFLLCSFSLFGEKGYRGFEWYKNTWTFPSTDRVMELEEVGVGYNSPFIYEKNILGEKTLLIFDFDLRTYELVAAGYILPKNKTEELKNKFKNLKKEELKTNITIEKTEVFEEYIIEFGETKAKGIAQYYTFSIAENIPRCIETERDDFNKDFLDPKGTGLITIYDYNDDTRCYIYESPDLAVVIYAPHEQDY